MAETFGKYQLVQKIAQGGMAEIFLATREGDFGGFEKRVAIKRIFQHLTGRDETVKMFFDEARIAATLNHPNIVQVFDLGEVEGYFYIAMEFVHGTDLRRICRRGLEREAYLSIELAVRIVADVAAGLHYAHTRTDKQGNPRHIVHRDISPQNILVGMEGQVKICDFGIAKAENRLARTRTGQYKGKLSYMSPEQFNGEQLDARSDVFNLGIVLYEVTLARRLFDAKTDFERMRQIAEAQVTPPSELRAEYPPRLERIVMRALRPNPADRYQSAEQMQMALEEWLHERERTVGPVQLSDYMDETFPELVGGLPREMDRVEFPTGASEGEASAEERDGGRESEPAAGPEVPGVTPEDPTQPVPRDALPTSTVEQASAYADSGDGGGQTGDAETYDEVDDETRPMQVSREELEAAVRETQEASAQSREEPAPTAELDGDPHQAPTDERDSSEFDVRQRGSGEFPAEEASPEAETDERTPDALGREESGSAPHERTSGSDREEAERSPTRRGVQAAREGRPSYGREAAKNGEVSREATTKEERPSASGKPVESAASGVGEPPPGAQGASEASSGPAEGSDGTFGSLEFSADAFGGRRHKWLALGGLAVALVALAVFGYLIATHEPELSRADGEQTAVEIDAGTAAGASPVERVDVELTTEPKGARAIVNGRDTGATTPTSVKLVAEKTNEVYLYRDGHRPARRMIEGRTRDQPRQIALEEVGDAEPSGDVEIETDPEGATAYLDGEELGETPVTAEEVVGDAVHHLRVEHEGHHPAAVLLHVASGETTPTSIDLAQLREDADDFCEVVYDVVPQGAMIEVDGEIQGTSEVAVRHECGEFLEISAWKSNYEDREHRLQLEEPGRYLLRSRLDKIVRARGTVAVEVPDSLRVFIGSNGYGRGSVEDLELAAGEHTLVLETDDRERFERTLTVRAGKTTRYRVRLEEGEAVLERVAR